MQRDFQVLSLCSRSATRSATCMSSSPVSDRSCFTTKELIWIVLLFLSLNLLPKVRSQLAFLSVLLGQLLDSRKSS